MKYRLIAIDVDGTLVDSNQLVAPETQDAIRHAQDRGIQICIATGRSMKETLPVWRQLPLSDPPLPMAVIGGAMVCDPVTQRTLYHRPIDLEVALELDAVLAAAGHSSLAFVDGWRHDADYYFGENGNGEAAMEMWFSKMNVRIRRGASLRSMPDMPAPMRINAVASAQEATSLARELAERFAGRLVIHSLLAPNYGVYVVEAFHPQADKYRAVAYIAQGLRIPTAAIAAIGDDVNDIPMLSQCGLGATFPHACQQVRDCSRHIVTDSLANFIRQVADDEIH